MDTKHPSPFITKGYTLKKELLLRGTKILGIIYVTAIYVSLAIIIAKTMNIFYGKFDETKADKSSVFRVYISIIIHCCIIAIFIYIARNIVEHIPCPFHNTNNYDHYRLSELLYASFFCLTMLQKNLFDKMNYVMNRSFLRVS